MFCTGCGASINDNSKFCSGCGTSVNSEWTEEASNKAIEKDTHDPLSVNPNKHPKPVAQQKNTLYWIIASVLLIVFGNFLRGLGSDLKELGRLSTKSTQQTVNTEIDTLSQEHISPSVEAYQEGYPDIRKYANTIADGLSKNQYPACSVVADNIRRLGDSSLPDEIKARQINSVTVPEICLR